MESCRRLRELRISFQIQVNRQDDLTSQLLYSRHRGKNGFFLWTSTRGGGGQVKVDACGRGGGVKKPVFCGRHKWTTPYMLLDLDYSTTQVVVVSYALLHPDEPLGNVLVSLMQCLKASIKLNRR